MAIVALQHDIANAVNILSLYFIKWNMETSMKQQIHHVLNWLAIIFFTLYDSNVIKYTVLHLTI